MNANPTAMTDQTSTDPAWLTKQYDPRVPERPMPDIIGEWMERSHRLWKRQRPETFRYGAHEREAFDFYRADDAVGTLIFYHGGYWRSCSKEDHAWIADAFLKARVNVAVMDYPLCPAVTVAEITRSVAKGFTFLQSQVLAADEKCPQVLAGHSAGGHLAASLLTAELGVPPRHLTRLAGMVGLSGLFDLRPLVHTAMNEWLALDAESADSLSPFNKNPLVELPVTLAVGQKESEEFHRQSGRLAEHWKGQVTATLSVPGRHHFDLLDDFAYLEGEVFGRVTKLLSPH